MSEISFAAASVPAVTPVYNSFLEKYMPQSNGSYVKVYLYLLYLSGQKNRSYGSRQAALTLNMIESDLLEAVRYWVDLGVMTMTKTENGICLGFPDPDQPLHAGPDPEKTKDDGEDDLLSETESSTVSKEENVTPVVTETDSLYAETGNTSSYSKVIRIEQRPNYSMEELSVYRNDPDIDRIFNHAAEKLINLSTNTMSLLYSLYDYYRLPFDVIDYLIDFCAQDNHSDPRYMEKLAQDWKDHNIQNAEQARAHVRKFMVYKQIMSEMGLNRFPTDHDCTVLENLMATYEASMELMLEGARRSHQKGNSFRYLEGVLRHWHDKNVHTLADVRMDDEKHADERNRDRMNLNRQKPSADRNRPAGKKNNFLNYEQRKDMDWDSWEREAAEMTSRELSRN